MSPTGKGSKPMIHLGYARVSTEQQSLDMQLAALEPLCGPQIWTEKRSGMTQTGRSELTALVTEAKRLRAAGEEVTIACYSLSRLGRRLVETVSLVEDLQRAGIGFRSLSESIDTTSALGRCFFNILVSLGQMEAELISERTRAGLQARKAAGQKLGPKTGDYSKRLEQAKLLIAGGASARSAAKQVGMTESTLRRLLKAVA